MKREGTATKSACGRPEASVCGDMTTNVVIGISARLAALVGRRAVAGREGLPLRGGVAELRPDDDGATFFQRADDALYRARTPARAASSRRIPGFGPA
jgi:hypothetical protein